MLQTYYDHTYIRLVLQQHNNSKHLMLLTRLLPVMKKKKNCIIANSFFFQIISLFWYWSCCMFVSFSHNNWRSSMSVKKIIHKLIFSIDKLTKWLKVKSRALTSVSPSESEISQKKYSKCKHAPDCSRFDLMQINFSRCFTFYHSKL